MKKAILLALALTALVACGPKNEGTLLPRNPDSGINTAQFDRMFNDVSHVGSTNELHDLLVVKDGKVIYERYDPAHRPDMKHAMWSASKTFTATAIGFAVQDGLLSVHDPVIKFFDKELPAEPSDTLKRLTVWNLLTMSSGFKHDYIGDTESLDLKNPTETMLHESFIFEPGTQFRYNSMNTYLLSVIVTKLTGQKVVDYLEAKLFKPLGIKDFYWKESAEGYSMGGWGLFIRPEDFAKMGQWMLQRGEWNGQQLLNREWFDEAMSAQIIQSVGKGYDEETVAEMMATDDWQAGYGYQMWRCVTGAYRLDGAWGQFSVVCPDKNAVIVANCLSNNAPEVLKYIWKNVYNEL